MATDFATEIRSFIVETFLMGQEDSLHEDTSLLDAGIIDSTGVLELVTFIEERYGIQVEDHELIPENLDSIANVAAYVHGKLVAAREAESDDAQRAS
jgi:acyl carrier protein